jgi:aminopeptidase
VEQLLNERVDADLRIIAEENTRALSGVSNDRIKQFNAARQSLRQNRMQRAANGDLRWCLTLFPTQAHAQDAQMSLNAYREFVFEACYLNDPDPVARWRELSARQARMIEWLTPRREVHVTGPETDLRLSIEGRSWNNSDGKRNFPSGEVFTGPIEDSANGVITYGVPSAVRGVEVENIRLVFENGKVVEASAEKGDDLLQSQLSADEGARYLGELGIGTNYNIQIPTKSILFDEKIGGTVHLALGQAYKETGGQNESAIHWDMICDLRQGGAIYLDGELFQENGRFKL